MDQSIPFRFGTDYYPEHWKEERWATDARMMREFGLDVVRLGEFSWYKMEPREGEFHFDWLDRAISVLANEGIKVILGTPTAAPPAWIIAQNPEIQPVDSHGLRHGFGGRHHDCQSNPAYRRHIARFVTAYANHFKDNPSVIGWQVDNELGNSHNDFCHCPHCRGRFQEWLQKKYDNIENLNERWGTAFWSQGYNSFEEIPTPNLTAAGHNPSHELDWKRFCSDLVMEFHDFQADIIRKAAPHTFITHNCMGFMDKFSYYDLAKSLDFMAHDQYPGGHYHPVSQQNIVRDGDLASELAFIRGLKNKPFLIMEQQCAITGWEMMGHAPKPGQLALWSMQSIAHGADAVMWFRWRSCLMGTEQYWHGLLPHSGIPGRNFHELEAFVRELKPLMPLFKDAMPPREAGILFSYDEEYAIAIQPHHPQLSYIGHLMTYYRALHAANIPTDFVDYRGDLSGYKLLIAPLYFLTWPDINDKLRVFVRQGGTLVLDIRSGIKDEDNLCLIDQPLPAGLCDLTGFVVDEYDCLRNGENSIIWDGISYPVQKWCDIGHTTTAKSLAVYEKEFYAGQSAITCNSFGQGKVYYVGTEMPEALARRMVQELQQASGVQSLGSTKKGVELVCRDLPGQRFLFALNHTGESAAYPVPEKGELLTPGTPGTLKPYSFQLCRVPLP